MSEEEITLHVHTDSADGGWLTPGELRTRAEGGDITIVTPPEADGSFPLSSTLEIYTPDYTVACSVHGKKSSHFTMRVDEWELETCARCYFEWIGDVLRQRGAPVKVTDGAK